MNKPADLKKILLERKADMQYKAVTAPIKDLDEVKGYVAGYFSTKNVRDSMGDIIVDGAFKRTIEERGPKGTRAIKTLYQHNPAWLLAVPDVLEEDQMGLYYENTISRTSVGEDVIKLIMDEVITEQSIGYVVMDLDFDDERDAMLLTEIKLYEGSYVTWGANSLTPIVDAKGTHFDEMEQRLVTIEKALRKGTWATEEIPQMFEIFVKQMRPVLRELRSSLPEEKPSGKDTSEGEAPVEPAEAPAADAEVEPEFTLADLWNQEQKDAQKAVDLKSIWDKEFESIRHSLGGTHDGTD